MNGINWAPVTRGHEFVGCGALRRLRLSCSCQERRTVGSNLFSYLGSEVGNVAIDLQVAL